MHHFQVAGSFRIAIGIAALAAVTSSVAYAPVAAAAVNRAPWISGTPAKSVTAQTNYSFTPRAGDADSLVLKFSIVGRPTWATFSTTTGKLSGTPPATATGKTFSGISIRASDGQLSTALPTFGISVVAPSTGSVTLSWTAPTQNVDGSPITGLQGYHVGYGLVSRSPDSLLYVAGGKVTSVTIEGLPRGSRYYFAVKAVAASGTSAYSNEVNKTI